jgi:hypothetical protein
MERLGPPSQAADGLFDSIRSAIRMRLAGRLSVAGPDRPRLRISPGAVQRELSDHNVTYKDAVETTRRQLAEMYLEQRQLPLTEIALLLGYSELSAFSAPSPAGPARHRGTIGAVKTGH